MIRRVLGELVKARPKGKTLIEYSPEKSKKDTSSGGSNGDVGRGIQEIAGLMRAIFPALEGKLGHRIDVRERLIAFLPEYAAYLLNRFNKGEDGNVAYQRLRGKKPSVFGLEFGEKCFYQFKGGPKKAKMRPRYGEGIFIGVRRRSNQFMICTPGGIVLSRDAKRMPIEDRWVEDCLSWIQWAPWKHYRAHRGADGDLPEGVPAEERHKETSQQKTQVIVHTRIQPPREFRIEEDDIELYGFTRLYGEPPGRRSDSREVEGLDTRRRRPDSSPLLRPQRTGTHTTRDDLTHAHPH